MYNTDIEMKFNKIKRRLKKILSSIDSIKFYMLNPKFSEICIKLVSIERIKMANKWFEQNSLFLDEIQQLRIQLSATIEKKIQNIVDETKTIQIIYTTVLTLVIITCISLCLWYTHCINAVSI